MLISKPLAVDSVTVQLGVDYSYPQDCNRQTILLLITVGSYTIFVNTSSYAVKLFADFQIFFCP